MTVESKQAVGEVWAAAVAAGAIEVNKPEDHDWGGCSGYVADPEGLRWEIVWVPGLTQ